MRVLYVALEPLKYPRIKKLATSFRKRQIVDFDVMIPKFRYVWRGHKIGRLLIAIINYITILLQILVARADLFWVANCPDVLVLPLILRRKRYILEYRSPWAIEVEDEFGSGPWVSLTSFFERFALRNAWIITLTTSKLVKRVKGYGKPTFVFPNYPLKMFGNKSIPRDQFRTQQGRHKDDKIILFVGKLTRVEGADMLPKIIKQVLKTSEAFFWIVGSGSFYASLEESAKEFPRKLKLFGWQPHDTIPDFILSADVCIAPRHKSVFSVYYNEEGVTKISEYMFFEKPIVACGVAESSEYLLVSEDEMAAGILQALNGLVKPSKRKTWEDHSEARIYDLFDLIRSGKI
jgi:glycosyltransferase involved in cell wall biosynthesis